MTSTVCSGGALADKLLHTVVIYLGIALAMRLTGKRDLPSSTGLLGLAVLLTVNW